MESDPAVRSRPKILFVDDEPRVLEGLVVLLRKDYEVHVATSGEQALQKMRELQQLAVVISDMRMPQMDGATFLQAAMQRCPHAIRMLLSGEAGRDAAILAVNKGQIFRFLSKPCPIEDLKTALEAAVAQHRLLNAERAVLQETLIGCIGALMEVLALANPAAFGRANHIKRLACELAGRIGCTDFWQLEAAALLSQVGYLSLPPEVVEKVQQGVPLTPDEQTLANGVPAVAIKLLDHIPRLDPVLQILTALTWTDAQITRLGEGTIGLGTRILGLTLEFDALQAQGKSKDAALQSLSFRVGRFGAKLFGQLGHCPATDDSSQDSLEIPLRRVVPGMTVLQELRTRMGILLAPKGFEVTRSFVERISNLAPELLDVNIRVAPKARAS
ncbi:MAG TPA: HD domain-containing phosphohydrolase [Steroidobacteraceae bacterium]